MPRQGVPYPERLMCSLKCELKNIWNALNGKLHSVNGVEGDGSGNVNIVSGDNAVTVITDPSMNQIEISLNPSQLPSAAVTSVNGETGAVVLDADDIAGRGAGNSVMDNIITLESGALILRSDLNDEITARGNADAALQTNINTVAASIPEISVTPDPNKVLMRDANGRGYAADPESGATDKSLVTANWISQTGDSAPNNVVHRTASETVLGKKQTALLYNNFAEVDAFTTSRAGWHRFFKINTSQGRWTGKLTVVKNSNDFGLSRACFLQIFVMINSNSLGRMYRISTMGAEPNIILTYDATDRWQIWIQCPAYQRTFAQLDSTAYVWRSEEGELHLASDWDVVKAEPASGDYSVYETVSNP